MAAHWVKLTGVRNAGGRRDAPAALNMNCVASVFFGEFSSGHALLHLTTPGDDGQPCSIFLGEADAVIVQRWLDAHAFSDTVDRSGDARPDD